MREDFILLYMQWKDTNVFSTGKCHDLRGKNNTLTFLVQSVLKGVRAQTQTGQASYIICESHCKIT